MKIVKTQSFIYVYIYIFDALLHLSKAIQFNNDEVDTFTFLIFRLNNRVENAHDGKLVSNFLKELIIKYMKRKFVLTF